MTLMNRLRKSWFGRLCGLTAILWLSLVPVAQAMPAGEDADGFLRYLVICTADGPKKIMHPDVPDPNAQSGMDDCAVCISLSVFAKVTPSSHSYDIAAPGPLKQRMNAASPGALSAVRFNTPDARAPPFLL